MFPRLVFVHGAGGMASTWDLQRLAFPGAVASDLPGHNDGGAGYRRVEDYARWLRAEGQAQDWFPAVLAGHSMGGAVALWHALCWPDDLAGIVLMATGARLRVAPEILTGVAADYPAAVDAIVARSLGPGVDPRLAPRLREAMLAVPQEVTVGDFEACNAFDVMDRLGEIHTPALVIAGREDRMTPPKFAEFLHAHLPRTRLVLIDGAGHMLHVERPREVNAAIQGFLDTLKSAR